jgi:hypothetical protein
MSTPNGTSTSFTPGFDFNAMKRKTKGLVKMFGGLAAPFYYTDVVVKEGTPMKLHATPLKMVPSAVGDGAVTLGLALQETYDESAFGQLKGYHFANDTRQRLDGMPIGLLTGCGYAATNYYVGTVAWNDRAYITASGMANSGGANDKLPVVFESGGTAGATLVRIRFDFPLVV